jgi:hypothetical protein
MGNDGYDLICRALNFYLVTSPNTIFYSKASKVQIRKSHSAPTNGPSLLPKPSPILPSSSELPKKEIDNACPTNITIPPSSNRNSNNKKSQKPIRLNSKLSHVNHFSSSPKHLSKTTSTHERPNLRTSASSRFGKNLLPTWLGGHSVEDGTATSPTSSIHSSASSNNLTSPSVTSPTSNASSTTSSTLTSSSDADTNDITNTFETLLV